MPPQRKRRALHWSTGQASRDRVIPSEARDLGGSGRDPSASPRNDTSDCCVHTVPVDVASDHDVQRARAERRGAGDMDVLVCSAGITGPNTTTWEYPVDAWRQVIDVNLNGLFYCNRAVVPIMQKRDYGRIVNIASVAGKEGNPNAPAYSASKAGVIGL